uniref:glucuronosyltransferase n=1 Tax=Heterorhabditis bacteriophora TaxID=37862 RepID=A0A1I7WQ60_HETBA
MLSRSDLLTDLINAKFDMGIVELFDYCGLGLMHLLNPHSLVVTSSSTLWDQIAIDIGMPIPPSYVPSSYAIHTDQMTFMQRLQNILSMATTVHFFRTMQEGAQKVFDQRFGSVFPRMEDLTAKASIVLTNSEPLLDFSRPTLDKVINIGGIGVSEPQKLTEEFDRILSLRKNTVLISFGSMAKSMLMPHTYRESILSAIMEMPDTTFIWKYENKTDDFAARVDNVVLSPWIPQNDLLNDIRLTAFVTHGGMASFQESVARVSGSLNILNHFKKNWKKYYTLIYHLLTLQWQKDNARRIAQMLAKRPFTAREKLIKNVEFACEFGEIPQFDPAGRHLNFIQYYLLDVLFCVVALLSLIVLFVFVMLKRVFRFYTEKKMKAA